MVQTNEHVGAQTAFHVLLHLVPRWENDHLIAPWDAERADADRLAVTRARILASVN
jgi:histidine triad (HIT) family protein